MQFGEKCPSTRDSLTISFTLYEQDLSWLVLTWGITLPVDFNRTLHQLPEQSHGVLQFIVISVSVIRLVG